MKSSKSGQCCGMRMSAQKASNRAIPKTTKKHKNPSVKPVGGKAMTGGKTK